MKNIINDIIEERNKQDLKWGQQNHPILIQDLLQAHPSWMCNEYQLPSEADARSEVELRARRKELTFMHILVEEISEAASCGADTAKLRNELIQCAAVIVAMIESLDRNGK